MTNILIVGCGYVGKALANHWKHLGHHVTGTTRSIEKVDQILQHCNKAEVLHSSDIDKLSQLVNENDIIVLTVAADTPQDYEKVYLQTAENLKKCAKSFSQKKLFYTSSTFVYGDHHGKWVDENSLLLNETEPAQILIETEKTILSIQKEQGWDVLIFRLSEIYGPNRTLSQRVHKYQASTLSGAGKSHTNMIHLDDIVKGHDYALNHHLTGIYNFTDNDHLSRSELYKQVANKFGYKQIKWDPSIKTLRNGDKRVSNHKIKSAGYDFVHPSRIIE